MYLGGQLSKGCVDGILNVDANHAGVGRSIFEVWDVPTHCRKKFTATALGIGDYTLPRQLPHPRRSDKPSKLAMAARVPIEPHRQL